MKRIILFTILPFLFVQNVMGQNQQVSSDSILVYFNEIKEASKKNIGLWDKEVYGPMLFVDAKSREIFTNKPDNSGVLKPYGEFYSGILPNNINVANTAMDWNGERWAMIMLPLPQNRYDRLGLLAHESFHRIQSSLGFKLNNAENNHLDQKEGRVYLRLELEALKKALQSTSEKELKKHVTHALTFRKYRHGLYDGSSLSENLLELNEGIAEFTGMIISGRNKIQTERSLVSSINDFFGNATFVRSFAYHTIPVYGYLLYAKDKSWNKKITSKTNLTDYLIKEFRINIPADLKKEVDQISDHYNGAVIVEDETKREEKTKRLIDGYKAKFINQPHFEIIFEKMNVSFDPRNIVPIEDKGTVYPNIRITDKWGILTAENGALMSPNWDKISISNPIQIEEKKISGDGWVLELRDGYIIKKNDTSGNYQLIKNTVP